jgi:phosphate transport system substrate-binding protein
VEEDDTPKRIEALKRSPAGAILLTSYDVYLENQAWTRLIPINGVQPSPETIVQEDYTLTTPLFLIAKSNLFRDTGGRHSAVFAWLTEALSERAIGSSGYLAKSGLMPLPLAKREAERTELKKLIK